MPSVNPGCTPPDYCAVVTWPKRVDDKDVPTGLQLSLPLDVRNKLKQGVVNVEYRGAWVATMSDGQKIWWGWPGSVSSELAESLKSTTGSVHGDLPGFNYAGGGGWAALTTAGKVFTWGSATGAVCEELSYETLGVGFDFATVESACCSLDRGNQRLVHGFDGYHPDLVQTPEHPFWTQKHSGWHASLKDMCETNGYGNTGKDIGCQWTAARGSGATPSLVCNDPAHYCTRVSPGAPNVADELEIATVTSLVSTDRSWAALTTTGKVLTWGHACCGGDSAKVQQLLSSNVTYVTANSGAMVALTRSGRVIPWGDPGMGGTANEATLAQLQAGVVHVESIGECSVSMPYHQSEAGVQQRDCGPWKATKADGTIVTWGFFPPGLTRYGDHLPQKSISSSGSWYNLSALVYDGYGAIPTSYVPELDLPVPRIKFQASDEQEIIQTEYKRNTSDPSFKTQDLELVNWFTQLRKRWPATIRQLREMSSNITKVRCNDFACVALFNTGRAIYWGAGEWGGEGVQCKAISADYIYNSGCPMQRAC
eukprot:COSAG05_NODE_1577_length_4502_cov_3.764706_2_plen_538_part_00